MGDDTPTGKHIRRVLNVGWVGEHQPPPRGRGRRGSRNEVCRHGSSSGQWPDGGRPALERTCYTGRLIQRIGTDYEATAGRRRAPVGGSSAFGRYSRCTATSNPSATVSRKVGSTSRLRSAGELR